MLQLLRFVIFAGELYAAGKYVYTHQVAFVPNIVGIHPDEVAVIGLDGEVVMVAFIQQEMHFPGEFSLVLMVQ